MVTLNQKILPPLGLIAITIIVVTLLVWTRPDTQAELQPLPPARVKTTEVRTMDIQPVTHITGKLQPARKASLRIEVSGNIINRFVEPGQNVSTGDILLQVEDGDFIDAVEEARAQYSQEKNAIKRDQELLKLTGDAKEILEREVQRLKKLGIESLASKSSLDESLRQLILQQEEQTRLQHSVDTAASRLQSRHAALSMAERNLQRTRLTAPFDGIINQVMVDVGDHISTGQIGVELVQMDVLDLYIEVTGDVAIQLQLDQEVKVIVEDRQITGKIYALTTNPDPDTNTHALRIRLPGQNLYPGQLAEVELPGKFLKDVDVVPVSSILRDEGEAFIFIVNNNKLKREKVVLLARQNDLQVISGVSEGSRIVSKDVAVLADGQEVFVE